MFLEVSDSKVREFSWEGRVSVATNACTRLELNGGDELLYRNDHWQPSRRLSREEVETRLAKSLLLQTFQRR